MVSRAAKWLAICCSDHTASKRATKSPDETIVLPKLRISSMVPASTSEIKGMRLLGEYCIAIVLHEASICFSFSQSSCQLE